MNNGNNIKNIKVVSAGDGNKINQLLIKTKYENLLV